jgi:hypothetical protein
MSFTVNASAIIGFAASLQETYDDAIMSRNYVHEYGDFSFNETGLIGVLSGRHATWVAHLDGMLTHLMLVASESDRTLLQVAHGYETTDEQTAARLDATYVAVPRTRLNRD